MSVDKKSNEIPAVPELLKLLELTGATVTLDALHCQVETAQAILDAGADYVLTVKGNQPTLHDRLSELFIEYGEANYQVKGLRAAVTVDKQSHGRAERRICYAIGPPEEEVFSRWPGIRSIGMIYRHSERGEEHHDAVAYFISSREPKVRSLSRLLRDHRKIENGQHYVLDVTFTEDASRIRKDSGPEISAGIRRMALNVLQRDTTMKDSIRGKRLRAGWDSAALDKLFAGFEAV